MAVSKPTQSNSTGGVDGQHLLRLRDLFQSLSSISAVSSLHQLLPHLARFIATSVGADRCSVFLFNSQATEIVDHLRWGYSDVERPLLARKVPEFNPRDYVPFMHVISSRQVLVRSLEDTPEELLPTNLSWRQAFWHGDMLVPLVWNDRVEGVAIVILSEEMERFEPLHVEIAQGVAQQTAGIINHLRATESERLSRQNTEMLLELSRTFSNAASIAEIYSCLADAVRAVVGSDAVSVVVHEPSVFAEGGRINRRIAAFGMTEAEQSLRNAILQDRSMLDSTVDQIAAEANAPILVQNIGEVVDDERLKQDYVENVVSNLLVIPVTVSGQLHGVIYAWRRNRALEASAEQLRICDTMANQAVASIERLMLVDAERRLRARTETLADVNRRFTEVLDPLDIVQIAAGAVRQALFAYQVTAFVDDPRGRVATAFVSDGADPDVIEGLLPALAAGEIYPDPQGMEHNGARVLDQDRVRSWHAALRSGAEDTDNPVRHVIELPLIVGGEAIGVMHAWHCGYSAPLSHADLQTAESIIADLALAFERVNLQVRERHEWNRAEMLLSFAEALNRSIDHQSVAGSILNTFRQHLPGIHAALAHWEGELPAEWTIQPVLPIPTGRAVHDLLDEATQNRTLVSSSIDGFAVLVVPLNAGEEPLGALVLARAGESSISGDDIEMASSLAPQAADAIQRARLFAVSERTVAELALLHEVGRAIAQRRRLPEIFDYMADEVKNLVDYSIGLLALDGHGQDALEIVSIWGDTPPEALGDRVPINSSIMGQVYLSHEPLVVEDVNSHPLAWKVSRANWRSLICVPLMTGARAIGTLLVGHPEPGRFTREDLRLASLLAGQAGAAIYQAREADRQRELYRAGVEALAAAVDAKDSYTHSHSRQVAELSRRTAEALGLDAEEVERIELAGLLHDVGKIGIPDHILSKPGRLDPQERLLMIGHATLGARIVAAHPALAELTDLVLHHHEWHNGSGYPDGLRGDEVPIGSAIIAVADAFDSMTTFRPYRNPLSIEAARAELTKWSGVQFHPRVIEAFLSTVEERDTNSEPLPAQTVDMRPIRAVDIIAPRVLSAVAAEIAGLTDLYPFLSRLQQIIREELKYDEVHIFLSEEGSSDLVLGASTTHNELVGRLRLSGGNGLAMEAARRLGTVNCADVNEDPKAGFIDFGMRSVLEVPLIVDDILVGVLGAASGDQQRFEARDEAVMEAIARQVAPTVLVSKLHDHARRTALIDGLTGVMNHRAFYLRLEEMIAQTEEWDNDLHLLIVDVVGLKAVNDVYGHLAGDRALIAVANALKNRVRGEDEIARYGGDEFVVIVRGTPRGGMEELAERITAPVKFTIEGGYAMSIRLRCGVATARSAAERATELVARADARLYTDIRPTERDNGII